MTKVARFASVLFAGLFAGFLVAVLILELSLRRFGGTVYTQVRQVELDSLDKLAIATLVPALIATALLAYRTFRTNTRWRTVAALALLLFIFALTLIVNLPINTDQLAWTTQSPPADWASVRDHWQTAHAVRTVAAVLAFGALATLDGPGNTSQG
ncbi:anthrone oxygenase family protein [Catelliglobosispora koreensis]|uniref:anthrone oxygenase family protein n=1 Tax=Catelliglobosispora koreensis TaxID=129052 RepID=UPI000373CBD3|nr:anthrone oxygenase family protein [Catelliglobosispora koreensis]